MIRDALLSPCGTYRMVLTREVPSGTEIGGVRLAGTALWVLNNPSTADAKIDDPTCRRCWTWTLALGCHRMVFLNTNPYRATRPELAQEPSQLVLEWNDQILREHAPTAKIIICAWGDRAKAELASRTLAVLASIPRDIYVLGLTQAGNPRHPLYLPGSTKPVRWLYDTN